MSPVFIKLRDIEINNKNKRYNITNNHANEDITKEIEVESRLETFEGHANHCCKIFRTYSRKYRHS